ncbi:hypothetical protein [Bradyrhizobium hipponense]|uniref:hypothetical protein n=1 Tax=Bradyrhizobium hipponense TaxID=2605638 RepID=UPI001F2AB9B6|nr:hypothetical protein [Bradyrhizobium hipponense]
MRDREQRLVLQRPVQLARDVAERSDDGAGEDDLSDRAERKHELWIRKLALNHPVAIDDREQERGGRQRQAVGDRLETQLRDGKAERQQAAHGRDRKPVQLEELPSRLGVSIDHAAPRYHGTVAGTR